MKPKILIQNCLHNILEQWSSVAHLQVLKRRVMWKCKNGFFQAHKKEPLEWNWVLSYMKKGLRIRKGKWRFTLSCMRKKDSKIKALFLAQTREEVVWHLPFSCSVKRCMSEGVLYPLKLWINQIWVKPIDNYSRAYTCKTVRNYIVGH